MNYSKQRETILDALKNNPVHPTADILFEIIKKEYNDSTIGIATVYRNLKKLADKGIIKRINGLENSEHFDYNTESHYHFICTNCKKIYDINDSIAPEIVEKIENNTDFIVEHCDIVIQGICKQCKPEINIADELIK